MVATVLEIQRKKVDAEFLPHPLDSLAEIEYAERGTVDVQSLLASPNVTLFSFDDRSRRAIFAETPEGIEVAKEAFLYRAQYKHAQRLYAVPYETFNRLAADLPDPAHLILIYSTGFCGSTLLHRVMNGVDEVTSLSEPFVYAQSVWLRGQDSSRDGELSELLRSATRIICRGQCPTWAIKFHSEVIAVADLLYELFPSSKGVFLYRNAEMVACSLARTFFKNRGLGRIFLRSHWNMGADQIRFWSHPYPDLKPYIDKPDTLSFARWLAIFWLSSMQRYVEFYPQGVFTCALRYEELTAMPRRMVKALFNRCGVPIVQIDRALQAFERDAKSGGKLSAEELEKRQKRKPLTRKQLAEIRAYISEQTIVQVPDFIVPGTLL